MYEIAWFNGRLVPIHNAHVSIIRQGLMMAKKVVITLGSCNKPRDPQTPWNFDERKSMIMLCFTKEERARISIHMMEDRLHNDHLWASRIQKIIDIEADGKFPCDKRHVVTIGSDKDAHSYWIHMFPQWSLNLFETVRNINSTDFRLAYFADAGYACDEYSGDYDPRVLNWLRGWGTTVPYKYVKEEQEFLKKHDMMWKCVPYPVSFNCADAVVFKDSHVLLVKRRSAPGKGLWACPGGYINMQERTLDSAIRELREETCLKVPEPVLKGSLIGQHVFDHPRRSLRGRVYSHAFAFDLKQPGPLPKVKGADDGEKAKWFTLNEFSKMRNVMFEDHADIVNHFIGLLNP